MLSAHVKLTRDVDGLDEVKQSNISLKNVKKKFKKVVQDRNTKIK